MKAQGLVLALSFLLTSCGVLSLNPKGCKSDGLWSEGNLKGRKTENELKFSETYFVWNRDQEVLLKDFLKIRSVECSEIKKMHIEMVSIFFVRRELTVFIQK